MDTKVIYIDTETGGVEPEKNALLQISGKIKINGKTKTEFDFLAKPVAGKSVEAGAMAVTGMTPESIEGHVDAKEIYETFVGMLGKFVHNRNPQDKFTFIGYNARFDMDFIRAFFEDHGNPYMGSYFWFPPIDVMNSAAVLLVKERHKLPNFKLETVAKYMGLEVDQAKTHEAWYDIDLTERLLLKVLGYGGDQSENR